MAQPGLMQGRPRRYRHPGGGSSCHSPGPFPLQRQCTPGCGSSRAVCNHGAAIQFLHKRLHLIAKSYCPPHANQFLPVSIQASPPARDGAGEHWKSPFPLHRGLHRHPPLPHLRDTATLYRGSRGSGPERPRRCHHRHDNRTARCPSAQARDLPPNAALPAARGRSLREHVTSGCASGRAGEWGSVPSLPLWPGPSMEKLRRVLSGQDDEEQGLTAQVRPRGDLFLFFPLPAPYAWWPPLTATELRLQGWRPLPRGDSGAWESPWGAAEASLPQGRSGVRGLRCRRVPAVPGLHTVSARTPGRGSNGERRGGNGETKVCCMCRNTRFVGSRPCPGVRVLANFRCVEKHFVVLVL